MIEYLVGFDFGQSHTSAAYIPLTGSDAGRCNPLFMGRGIKERNKISSVIYGTAHTDADGTASYTYSFKKTPRSVPIPTCKDTVARLNADPQRKEATRTFIRMIYRTALENNPFLKEGTARHAANFRLAVACGTSWTERERSEYHLFVEEALGREVEYVVEESAAALHVHGCEGLNLIVDYGARTIDYALFHNGIRLFMDLSPSRLGAGQVEQLLLSDYKLHSVGRSSYAECVKSTREAFGDSFDVDSLLLARLRREKENSYENDENGVSMSISPKHELAGIMDNDDFRYRCHDLDALLRKEIHAGKNDGYAARVEERFRNLRRSVSEELDKRRLPFPELKLILCGGGFRMPLARESIMNAFGTDGDETKPRMLWDPAYDVSEGVAKYAYAMSQERRSPTHT